MTRSRHRVVLSWPEVSAGGLSVARAKRDGGLLFPVWLPYTHRHPGRIGAPIYTSYYRACPSALGTRHAWGKIRILLRVHVVGSTHSSHYRSTARERTALRAHGGRNATFLAGPRSIHLSLVNETLARDTLRHAHVLPTIPVNRTVPTNSTARTGRGCRPTSRERVSLRANA